jgi:hypothetical protein
MTINEYKEKVKMTRFVEFPHFLNVQEKGLSDIVNFDEADIELKIHLVEVVICRCFPIGGGIYFPTDSKWLITNFLHSYEINVPNPAITSTIKEAIRMIISENVFTENVIGTTFMFGVIEQYAKYLLGYKPTDFDFFDKENHQKFRNLPIGQAINQLKKQIQNLLNHLSELINILKRN